MKEEMTYEWKMLGEGKREKPPETPLYRAGRNEPCPCGSGKKFKKCCIRVTLEGLCGESKV